MDRKVLALRSNNKEISGLKVKETSQPSAGFLYFNRMKGWLVGPRLSYQRYRQCRERGREGGREEGGGLPSFNGNVLTLRGKFYQRTQWLVESLWFEDELQF